MLIIEFTNTYGDVGRVEILRIFHPWPFYMLLATNVICSLICLCMFSDAN